MGFYFKRKKITYEFVIAEDGSNDKTKDIIKSLSYYSGVPPSSPLWKEKCGKVKLFLCVKCGTICVS